MRIPFVKMQATGNDFVAVDNRSLGLPMEEIVRVTPKLCDRRFGVGADGTLFLNRSEQGDFTMVYRNADGSDAGMCGNGGRAISRFARDLGMGDDLRFDVHGKLYAAKVEGDEVKLSFLSLECAPEHVNEEDGYSLYRIYSGTDHAVVVLPTERLGDLNELRRLGRTLRHDSRFAPNGTNVNFTALTSEDRLVMRTYERGVEDLTLACGTGAIATAIVQDHLRPNHPETRRQLTVECLGGLLHVGFSGGGEHQPYREITLHGRADRVFESSIEV